MEILLRVLAIPVTLVTSVAFCLIARFAFKKMPSLIRPSYVMSTVVLILVVASIAVCMWPGPRIAYEKAHVFYWAFYAVGFIFGPPAVATQFMVFAKDEMDDLLMSLFLPVIACWFTCVVFVFWDLFMYAAIFGLE